MEKTEVYRDFTISWQEPLLTTAQWTANVASEHRHLYALMGHPGAEIIGGGTRDEMIVAAKKYIDSLLG
jgi:hypothetical protein